MTEPDLAALLPEETLEKLEDYYMPPYITLAHIFNAPRGWGFSGRVLKQHAINYVIEGAGEFTVEDHAFQVEKGDVFYYRPYESHGLRTLQEQDFLSITIVFHCMGSPLPLDLLMQNRHYLGRYTGHPVEEHFSELVAKYAQHGLHNRLLCQGLLLLILAQTSPQSRLQLHEPVHKNVSRLVLVKNHIENQLDRELNAGELERISGLTWNYLISRFSRTFGITPAQFLIRARIRKAKELALQTPLSFGEIAHRIGYQDVHSLGKMFKRKTGMSLSEFCASVCETDHSIDWPGKS